LLPTNASPPLAWVDAEGSGAHLAGQVLARYGHIAGEDAVNKDNGFLDVGLSASATTPASAHASSYVTQRGETLQTVARAVYGDARLWYRLADANGLSGGPGEILSEGLTLALPNLDSSANSVDTFRPYDPSAANGHLDAVLPDLPMPQDQGGGGCGAMGQIIMLVVTIAVAYYTGQYLGAETSLSATQVAAASAAAGSVAGQVTGNALGVVHGFSWSQVALSAISAGIGQGLGGDLLKTGEVNSLGNSIARAAIGNALTQGVAVVTGLQDHFNWTSVAASAVGAGVGYGVNSAIGSSFGGDAAGRFAKGLVSGLASGAAVNAMRGGKVSIQQVATDAFGNALGESFVGMMQPTDNRGMLNASNRASDPDYYGTDNRALLNAANQAADPDYYGVDNRALLNGANQASDPDYYSSVPGEAPAAYEGPRSSWAMRNAAFRDGPPLTGGSWQLGYSTMAGSIEMRNHDDNPHLWDERSTTQLDRVTIIGKKQSRVPDYSGTGDNSPAAGLRVDPDTGLASFAYTSLMLKAESAGSYGSISEAPGLFTNLVNTGRAYLNDQIGFGEAMSMVNGQIGGFGNVTKDTLTGLMNGGIGVAEFGVNVLGSGTMPGDPGALNFPKFGYTGRTGTLGPDIAMMAPMLLGVRGARSGAAIEVSRPAGVLSDGMLAEGELFTNRPSGVVELQPGAASAPNPLRAGQLHETAQLARLGVDKNNSVFRPSAEQMDSAAFKVIVGEPKYTRGGQVKGTIFDSVDNGYLEIKGGYSELNSTYQLRLQTYKATIDRQPFTIQTTRPVNPQFQTWLDSWGVNVVKPR